MLNNDLEIYGLYRAIMYYYGGIPYIWIPGQSSLNMLNDSGEIDTQIFYQNKECLLQGVFISNELKNKTLAGTYSCWVTFDTSDNKRPVITGYFGNGMGTYIAGDDGGFIQGVGFAPGAQWDTKLELEDIITDSELINKVIKWAKDIANDDSHWYVYGGKGPTNYDCSGFIWAAYNGNGLPDLPYAATGSMLQIYTQYGFENVTKYVNLSSGEGLQPGDILLAAGGGHVDMYIGNGYRVGAHSSKSGIYVDAYGYNQSGYNNKYDIILRHNSK